LKAALIDEGGVLHWWDREEFALSEHYEGLSPARLWMTALKQLVSRLGDTTQIEAISISGHGPTLVPVDRDGEPLEPVLMWNDGRRLSLENVQSFYVPQAAWLSREKPQVYERTRTFLSCPEYISFRLTGIRSTFNPSPDFAGYIWSDREIEHAGLDREKFPPFFETGAPVGTVTETGAQLSGIPRGTPLFAGGSDFVMSLFGTATVAAGRTCDRAGTSEGINYCSATPVGDTRLRMLPHPVAGLYNVAGILSSTGTIFEWYRSLSGQRNVSYDVMLTQIRSLSEERHIPWFFPSIHQGAAWEFSRGMFIELGAQHGPIEMGRAVVESIGYAVREAVEILEQNGCAIEELRTCGGQARNGIWNQMKADMIGKPVQVGAVVDAELLGDACSALQGVGRFSGMVEAAEQLYAPVERYDPRPSARAFFVERYERYVDAYTRFRTALGECDLL
jgi:xylulokinase